MKFSIAPIATIALVFVATAQACLTTCSTSGDKNGVCSYHCTQACDSVTAHTAASNFLGALQARGYVCDFDGVEDINCTKDAKFGECNKHYWTCGKGC